MDRVPILKIGTTLFVSIQIDLQDESVVRLQEDLADELAATGARGVISTSPRWRSWTPSSAGCWP